MDVFVDSTLCIKHKFLNVYFQPMCLATVTGRTFALAYMYSIMKLEGKEHFPAPKDNEERKSHP